MGDRRSSFPFRFWSSATPASRQQPKRQTTAASSTVNDSAPNATPRAASQSVNRTTMSTTNSTSAASRRAENKTRGRKSTSNISSSSSTTPPIVENQTLDGQKTPPKTENKTPENTTNSTSTIPPTIENKILDGKSNSSTTSPNNQVSTNSSKLASITLPTAEKETLGNQSTNATTSSRKGGQIANKQNTESPPSSQPVTPSRLTTQSRSPSQHSSPPHIGSQTLSTPQRTSQPHSPYRGGSRTPNHKSSTNPSKESRRTTEEKSSSYGAPTLVSNQKDLKHIASQQEPQLKSNGANDNHDQTMDGTSSKHNEVEVMPSKSSQLGTTTRNTDSSTINGGHEPIIELNAKPEETKDVKEVQATNTKANEEAKKEVNDLLTPKPGPKAQITEKATSFPSVNPTNTKYQPTERSTILNKHNKSALPIGEHVTSHKDVRNDISKFVNQMGVGDLNSAIYDKPVSVITLAGENRGASMQMGSNSSKTEGPVHIHRSYKINPDESVEATADGEGSSKEKKLDDAKSIEDQPPQAYVNNNAQGINNSIVLHSSVTEKNPGVHMVVAHVPKEPIQSTNKASTLGTGKSENNMTRIDKLTYEPTIRRRCLRGLFLETSDSDPENPQKPQRHGCRIGCQQPDKENDRDVL